MQIRLFNPIYVPITQLTVVAFMRRLRLEKIQVGWIVVSFILIKMMSCFVISEVSADDRFGNEDVFSDITLGTPARVIRTQPKVVSTRVVSSASTPSGAICASRYTGKPFFLVEWAHVLSPTSLSTINRTELGIGAWWAAKRASATSTERRGLLDGTVFRPATPRAKPLQNAAVLFSGDFDTAMAAVTLRDYLTIARVLITIGVVASSPAVFSALVGCLKRRSALFTNFSNHKPSLAASRCDVKLYDELMVIA